MRLLKETGSRGTAQTIAAVDLGSNSFHLMVAQQSRDGFRVLDRLREPVRLGAGFSDGRHLDDVSMERALACLERFGARLAGIPSRNVRAVGTNALRQAQNSSDFLKRACVALGHPIDIISGHEEARLIYAGVAHGLATDSRRRFVVDVGGGSTELILGCNHEPEIIESLQMGCVSFSRRFFSEAVATPTAMREATLHSRSLLEGVADKYRSQGWDENFGASGALRTIGSICESAGGSEQGITVDALQCLEEKLVALGRFERFTCLGVSEDRAEVLAAGVCIVRGVLDTFGIERLHVIDAAIREGLLLDVLENRMSSKTGNACGRRFKKAEQ